MRYYVGERTPDGCQVAVLDTEKPDHARLLNPRYDLRNHSPDGFEFGFAGSGPSQLSLALLADALGDDERARANYQAFKFKVVGRLTGDVFKLTEEDIRQKVAELEAEKGRAR